MATPFHVLRRQAEILTDTKPGIDKDNWADEQRTNLQTATEIAQELQNYGCRQAKNTTVGRILTQWAEQGKHGIKKCGHI